MVKVTLMSWTMKPIETVYWAFMNMHNPIPDSLDKIQLTDKDKEEFLEMLMAQPHQTVLEFVNTVWYIEGASRAFQQQLTRTRQAAYSIQSLRIVPLKDFADRKGYTKSSAIKTKPEAEAIYDDTMKYLQNQYNKLMELGCPTEDARGVLPLNIHSPITMAINMRSLYHLLELRFCHNTQEEYREMAEQMKKEIATKIHPLLTKPMVPLCFKEGHCPSPVYCGKYPNFKQKIQMDVSKWIKG